MLIGIPLFALIGFLLNTLWYALSQLGSRRVKVKSTTCGGVATVCMSASFICALVSFIQLYQLPEISRVIEFQLFHWIHYGPMHLDFTFRLDPLSSLFTLVITGVGALIHAYSIGYMEDDETPAKFFAYLNLFCFAMLILVLGASLPVLFLGWEGVGLCSYLLIGYWYSDIQKASAGRKAFIVNRVGDFGFLLGMFFVFQIFGTLDFLSLENILPHIAVAPWMMNAIGLLFFVGCMGKSAQIPLYVWLPDAMAGPTPVSALIHAATMVTSGVYLVSRLNFLYYHAPMAMEVMAIVGVTTALFAATIAVVQTDIKKVLAYSTVSQLGYLFLGCGVGAYTAGVFHVITHAFFKALLFLGAGSVIHGMHHDQNILNMGGLKQKMPKTSMTFMIGWLAICGLPPFSGFFSKDEILWQAFSSTQGSRVLWLVGFLTAILTAFYMTRLFVLVFHGPFRGKNLNQVHESPGVMIVPLQILAILSLVGGWIGIPHVHWLEHWLAPVFHVHGGTLTEPVSHFRLEALLMCLSTGGALLGVVTAWKFYQDLTRVKIWSQKLQGFKKILENKWYVDEIYHATWVTGLYQLSRFFWKVIDLGCIDPMVLSVGKGSLFLGNYARKIQKGSIQIYLLVLFISFILTAGYLFYASF